MTGVTWLLELRILQRAFSDDRSCLIAGAQNFTECFQWWQESLDCWSSEFYRVLSVMTGVTWLLELRILQSAFSDDRSYLIAGAQNSTESFQWWQESLDCWSSEFYRVLSVMTGVTWLLELRILQSAFSDDRSHLIAGAQNSTECFQWWQELLDCWSSEFYRELSVMTGVTWLLELRILQSAFSDDRSYLIAGAQNSTESFQWWQELLDWWRESAFSDDRSYFIGGERVFSVMTGVTWLVERECFQWWQELLDWWRDLFWSTSFHQLHWLHSQTGQWATLVRWCSLWVSSHFYRVTDTPSWNFWWCFPLVCWISDLHASFVFSDFVFKN